MCTVTEADFASLDKKSVGLRTRAAMNVDELRRGYRRYRGDDPYRTLEHIRSRLAAGSGARGLLARAETGYVGFAAQLRKRRTRRHGAGGWHTPDDVRRLYDQQRGCCFYCGAELNARYAVDHKTPLSRGGTDWPENLCCACEYCVSHKEERTEEEFADFLARMRRRRSQPTQ